MPGMLVSSPCVSIGTNPGTDAIRLRPRRLPCYHAVREGEGPSRTRLAEALGVRDVVFGGCLQRGLGHARLAGGDVLRQGVDGVGARLVRGQLADLERAAGALGHGPAAEDPAAV